MPRPMASARPYRATHRHSHAPARPLAMNTQAVPLDLLKRQRNDQQLLKHISGRRRADGKLCMRIFCHCELTCPFETEHDDDWMSRHSPTDDLMPAADTFMHLP